MAAAAILAACVEKKVLCSYGERIGMNLLRWLCACCLLLPFGLYAESRIVYPETGSTLECGQNNFSWESIENTRWLLWIGWYSGSASLHDSGVLSGGDSYTVDDLPMEGGTIYVRLWRSINGEAWEYTDTEYTACNITAGTPRLHEPYLTSDRGHFNWEDNDSNANAYWLYIGSSVGASNFFDSGNLGSLEYVDVEGLPYDGRQLHVRLWYRTSDGWGFLDQQHKAYDLADAPAPSLYYGFGCGGVCFSYGGALRSSEPVFQIRDDAKELTNYWLYAGSTIGGRNYFDSGLLGDPENIEVVNLPVDGTSVVWTRLWYRRVGGGWQYIDTQWVAALPTPVMTFPVPGYSSTSESLSDRSFRWFDPTSSVRRWWLYLGTTLGGRQLADSGRIDGQLYEHTTGDIDWDGTTPVYMRLWYLTADTSWQYIDRELYYDSGSLVVDP